MWERVAHWLDRIVPVAEEYQIQVACHPQNPTIGDATYRGVARILGDARGFERLMAIRDSAYHGINFCVGTFSESLRQPANEIHDVIRYFGTRGKIFNLHLRNIKGGFGDFVEVFPADGDVDMQQVLRTLREVGYGYMVMPDHVPTISDDEPTQVGFAYTYGYLRALLQTLEAEPEAGAGAPSGHDAEDRPPEHHR